MRSPIIRTTVHSISLAVCSALAAMAMNPVMAEEPPAQIKVALVQFNIAPGSLGEVLARFASAAGVTLSFDAATLGDLRSAGLQGRFSVEAGFARLLSGSGYEALHTGNARYVLRRVATAGATLPPVAVSALAEAGLPSAYAGGQVARGARLGALGNLDVMDTPFSVTSYTSELIKNQQARTIADVVANDPSIRFTTSSGHPYENFRVRGYDLNQNDIALNGMYGLLPVGRVPIEFVERVEVLKGPSALFSGMAPSGAIGGVINLVPKRAGDDPLTQVSVGYRTQDQFVTTADIGRRFGEDKEIGVRVNASLGEGETERNNMDRKRELLAAALDYRGRDLKVSLDVYRSKETHKGGTPAMFWFSTTAIPKAPDPTTNQFPGASGWIQSNAVIARGEYDINRNLSAFASIGLMQNDYAGFFNGSHVRNINANGTSTTTTTSAQMGYNNNLSAETGLRARFETGAVLHELVVHATQLEMEAGSASNASTAFTTNIYNPVFQAMPSAPTRAPKTSENKLSSFAVVDTLSFLDDALRLTLGLRNQRVRTQNFNATGAVTSSDSKSVVAPAIAVLAKPWGPSLSLYANYVEGLSQGERVTDTAATNYNQYLKPYETEQKEVGAKWDTGKFSNTLSVFELTKPFMLSNNQTPATYVEGGEKRVRGIEWSTFGEVSRNVRLLGGLTHTQGVQTKTANGVNNGKDAVGAPRWQGNLGLEWDTPWVSGLTLSSRVIATQRQFLDSANTQTIPGWAVMDVGARYTTRVAGRKTVMRVNIDNLFDRHYYSGAFSDSTPIATLGMGRTLAASATVDF